jgi:serine/threonine protein kinase
MTEKPDPPPPSSGSPDIERVVEAISEGRPIEWDEESARHTVDPETLEALKLIDTVSRLHRSGGARAAAAGEAASEAASEASPAGHTWGNFRILGSLGAGVYGDVYRAFDPALQQEVALKLWDRTAGTATIEALLGEGRQLVKVKHPNVLLVLGADVHDGQVGMWTELLQGATLEQLLATLGPGHWREMALFGIDLCRALGAVHAVGLVHRDVKAANVMRERGGRIVLMDFGSAGTYAGATAALAPGAPEGTPLAMATEVLNGEPATPASDLFSLGVLIFRLVAGRYPLDVKTMEELRAAHARGPLPSLRSVRPDVPDEFADVVARALERDPARRFASALEMERALGAALTQGFIQAADGVVAAPTVTPVKPPAPPGLRPLAIAWAAAAVVLAAVLVGEWRMQHTSSRTDDLPMQFTIDLPRGEHLAWFGNIVVSPDGSRVVFATVDTSGTSALWVRRFDSLTSTRLPGTEDASYPFWSPDGGQVAFFANGMLKRVGTDGDSVRTICEADLGRGGTWGRDGTVLFSPRMAGPLLRVPARGGVPVPATALDSSRAEGAHRWPYFLPDGEHFLYVTLPEREGKYPLFVGSLKSDRRTFLGTVESGVVYSSGLIIYLVNEGLEARPFDIHSMHWAGDPRPLSAIPGYGGSPAEPHASVSGTGTLVYAIEAERESRMVWIDARTGDETAIVRGPYFDPVLSPDGRRIAAERVEGAGRSNLWMIDVASGQAERWTDYPGINWKATWSPAGDSLLYSSSRGGKDAIYARRTDGSLAERLVVPEGESPMMWTTSWPRRGPITLTRYDAGSQWNLYALDGSALSPLVASPASESRASVSPDGHWLAFDSNRSGPTHVRLLDLRTHEEFVLAVVGGMDPHWASAAGTLFFRTSANDFFAVTPAAGRRPTEWPLRRLFRTAVTEGYDVTPDGARVLCCLKTEGGRPEEVAVLVHMGAAVKQ